MTVILADGTAAGWRNPGFLPFDERYQASYTWTQLVPDVVDDIWLRSVNLTGPIPVSWAPFPIAGAISYSKLAFGETTFIDDRGQEGPTFDSFDRAFSFSLAGRLRHVLSLGASVEFVDSKLSAPIPQLNIGSGRGKATSVSVGAALSPTFTIGAETESGGFVLTPLAGISYLHWGQEIDYGDGPPEQLPRQLHLGAGLRVAYEPKQTRGLFDASRLVQIAITAGIERNQSRVGSDDDIITHKGLEVAMCGFVSWRVGYIDDPEGRIVNDTHGFGIGLEHLTPFGLRIDYGQVPQALGLRTVDRWSVVINLDRQLWPASGS